MKPANGVTRREVISRLSTAQKSNRGAAPYSRWVNRRIGRQIAALAYLAELTPNQVTGIGAALTFPAILGLAVIRLDWLSAAIVTVMLLIGYAFDSADGQLARLTGGGSAAGEWLDHVLDAVKESAFHVAVAIMWFRFFDIRHMALLLIPLGYSVVSSVFFFAMVLSDMLRRVESVTSARVAVTVGSRHPNEAAPVLRSLLVLLNDYGLLCLSLLLIPLHGTFVLVYATLFVANCMYLLVGSVRWFREMSRLRTD